jgi:hypothetical protein
MKRFLEFVLCILHPIARVLIWINLATRTNLELIPKFTRRDCGGRALRVSRVCAHCQRLLVADGQAGLCVGRHAASGVPEPRADLRIANTTAPVPRFWGRRSSPYARTTWSGATLAITLVLASRQPTPHSWRGARGYRASPGADHRRVAEAAARSAWGIVKSTARRT